MPKEHHKLSPKLVFISYLPLTTALEAHYNLQYYKENGISVEYWDVSQFFFPNLEIAGTISREYVVKFKHKKELKNAVTSLTTKEASPVLFIPQVTREYRVVWLLHLLKKHNCSLGFFDQPSLPVFALKRSFKQKIIAGYKNPWQIWRFIKGVLGNHLVSILLRVGYIAEYNIVFCSGEYALKQWIGKQPQKIIGINSPDYDKALLKTNSSLDNRLPERYIVFLDEYLPFHPDFAMLGLSTVEAGTYFALLNAFFSYIENQFSTTVVIAAHPKADYSRSNPFQGRLIVYNLSCLAAQNSMLVLGHASTSVGFAAIFKKPLCLLHYAELRNRCPGVYRLMTQLSSELSATLIDIGKEPGAISIKIDHVKQATYVQKYLTTLSSQHHQSREIIIRELRSWHFSC